MLGDAVEKHVEGTDLFYQAINFDYRNQDSAALMFDVWRGTPWMVDVFTGGFNDNYDREHEICTWCTEKFGPEAWPIHGRSGNWHRGGATINGWTWMGFATKEMMTEFMVVWGDVQKEIL